jgi:histidine triad (HIT) family protein
MDDCVFCSIVAGQLPAEVLATSSEAIAIQDRNPVAPVHALVISKRHVESVHAIGKEDEHVLMDCLRLVRHVADLQGVGDGYRILSNVGLQGGQTVFHLHIHLLGGTELGPLLPSKQGGT